MRKDKGMALYRSIGRELQRLADKEREENLMNRRIQIAADNIESLRKSDVFRVLDENVACRENLADWISKQRPDLAPEVTVCLADLDNK